MNRIRTVSAALICASLMTLAACGDDDTATTAGSTPSAAVAASATFGAASSAPAVTTVDKALCESVKKAGDEMKKELINALKGGAEPTPAVYKKILTGLSDRLTKLAAVAGDGTVSTTLKEFAAQATKAAAAADPMTASEDPAFEKTGQAITAACVPTGVNPNF